MGKTKCNKIHGSKKMRFHGIVTTGGLRSSEDVYLGVEFFALFIQQLLGAGGEGGKEKQDAGAPSGAGGGPSRLSTDGGCGCSSTEKNHCCVSNSDINSFPATPPPPSDLFARTTLFV